MSYMAQRMARPRLGRKGIWVPGALLGVFVLAAVLGLTCYALGVREEGQSFELRRGDDESLSTDASAQQIDEPPTADVRNTESSSAIFVHVDGAVASPGVFRLQGASPRVQDAVAAAGGLLDDADTTALNLAAIVADGQKLHVPYQGEPQAPSVSQPAATNGSSAASSSPVNINEANEAMLESLPGIGAATAAAIVRDRESNGRFSSIDDLMRVSGIGEKKFEKLKDRICV